jgi:hypothetical protein
MSAAFCKDGQNRVEVAPHGVIRKADNLGAGTAQVSLPSFVVRTKLVVHPTVHFDDKPKVRAVEVHHVAHDDVLTTELPAAELAVAKGAPEPRLCLRRLTAHHTAEQDLDGLRARLLEWAIGRRASSHAQQVGRLHSFVVGSSPSPRCAGGRSGWGAVKKATADIPTEYRDRP